MKMFNRYVILVAILMSILSVAYGARLKDVANVKGVRGNILIGYGIVVGLQGTGDSSSDVTAKSLGRLFGKLGLDVKAGEGISSKNAAAVITTATLPPFARVGNRVDVTVSSIGDAKSLEGGMLLVTPLRAGDQNVYAVAQGAVTLGAITGSGGGFPTVGRVIDGATIEKDLDLNFNGKKNFRLSLHNPDFTTAARVVTLINGTLGGKFAAARDSGTIDVVVPFNYENNAVELLATLENIRVNVDNKARIVLNEKTGTIVMGKDVGISPIAIAHGDLSIEVKDTPPPGAAPGRTVAQAPAGGGDGDPKMESIVQIRKSSNVSDLVRALNALGVKPKDMTAIFQTLKRNGALQAELEVM